MGLDNPLHIAFLLVILLLVFGAKRLPEMGRSLGEGLRGFKDAIGGETSGLNPFGEHGQAAGGVAQTQAAQSPVAQPHATTAQPLVAQPPAVAAAPVATIVATPAPSADVDPQLVAAARTLGARKAVAPAAGDPGQ